VRARYRHTAASRNENASQLHVVPLGTIYLQRQQKREQKLAVSLFMMSTLSLITCLPYNIFRIMYFQNSYYELYDEVPDTMTLLVIILYTNSLINPIVYLFKLRNFRKAFSKFVFKCWRYRPFIHPSNNNNNIPRQPVPAVIELGHMPTDLEKKTRMKDSRLLNYNNELSFYTELR
jgi:hypothetical protein